MANGRKSKYKKRKRTVIRKKNGKRIVITKKNGKGKNIRSKNRYGVGGSSPQSRYDTGGSTNLSFRPHTVSMAGEPRSRFSRQPPPPPSYPPPISIHSDREPEPEPALPTAEEQLRRSLGLGPRSMVLTPKITMGTVTSAKRDPPSQKQGKKVNRRLTVDNPHSMGGQKAVAGAARQSSKDAAKAAEADKLRKAQQLSAGRFWSQVPGGAAAAGAADWNRAHHAGEKPSKGEQQKMRTDFKQRVQQDTSKARKLMDNK